MSVLAVTIRHTFLGRTVDNCIGAVFPDDNLDSADCLTVATDIGGRWGGNVMPVLHNELRLVAVDVTEVDDTSTGATATFSTAGGISGALLPSFAAAKVQFHTSKRGRAYRGRTGLAGITEDMTDSLTPNTLKGTVVDTLEGQLGAFMSDANSDLAGYLSGGKLAVVSTILHGAPRVPAIGTPWTSLDVASQLGTRRSRL